MRTDAIVATLLTRIRMWRTSNLWWVVLQLSLTCYTQGDSEGGSHCRRGEGDVCMNICLILRDTKTELFDSTNTEALWMVIKRDYLLVIEFKLYFNV